jgi:cytochrome c oxidase subunit 1
MLAGLYGMRRRIGAYQVELDIQTIHIAITIAGYAIAFSILLFLINAWMSLRRGTKAADNPWNSRSPEFMVASPMPAHNYAMPFEVVGEPYDYGLPGSTYVRFEGAPAAAD